MGTLFPPVAGHLPNDALSSELTVESRAEAFAAVFDLQALATFPAKAGFVLLTDRKGVTVRMVFTLHPLIALLKSFLSRLV